MSGCQPGPGTQLLRAGEPGDIADLGDEDRCEDRSDPVDGLHRQIARMTGQFRRGPLRHDIDLEIEGVDQPAQRHHPGVVGRIQSQPVEQLLPADPEQIRHRHVHALFGQHRMDLRLEPGAQPDQFRPMPHRLAQLAHRRRGDPRLRQPAHP